MQTFDGIAPILAITGALGLGLAGVLGIDGFPTHPVAVLIAVSALIGLPGATDPAATTTRAVQA